MKRDAEQKRDQKTQQTSFTDGIRDPAGRLYKYTRREQLFVFNYLTDPKFNASAAARAAGYDCSSDGSFRALAAAILKKEHIQAAINAAFEALTMPKHEVLFRLARIAGGDITDVLNDNNELDLDHARDNGTAFLLKKISIRRTRREVTGREIDTPPDSAAIYEETATIEEQITFEIHDPLRALEMLGKHSKLFVDRIEQTGKDGQPLNADDAPRVVVYLPDNGRGDADNGKN